MGFDRSDIQQDLHKKLQQLCDAKEEDERHPFPTVPLLQFREMYPIIFEAFVAVFGCMPSNSQLTEQIHGTLRDSLIDGTSFDMADARQFYMTNTVYYTRKILRRIKRKEITATRDSNGTTGIKEHRKSIGYADTKKTQIKDARLLQNSKE